jgi:hypothetical protein
MLIINNLLQTLAELPPALAGGLKVIKLKGFSQIKKFG